MTDPYELPPGPERRHHLRKQGRAIDISDFTAEENAAIDADLKKRAEGHADGTEPIDDMIRESSA